MPSGRIDQSLYVGPYQSIEQINTTTLYKPGELGSQVQIGSRAYQLVQLDSGATSATTAGAVLHGSLAFWKDMSKYLVTNDKVQAQGGNTNARNMVAGVFLPATFGAAAGQPGPTPGNYCVIQQRGPHVGVKQDNGTAAAGQFQIPYTAATAGVDTVTVGTAPIVPPVGKATAATSAVTTGYTPIWLGGYDLVEVP